MINTEKYESKIIKSENLRVFGDVYFDDEDIRHEVVKLKYIPSNIEVVVDSVFSRVSAYNLALIKLEKKVIEEVNAAIEVISKYE